MSIPIHPTPPRWPGWYSGTLAGFAILHKLVCKFSFNFMSHGGQLYDNLLFTEAQIAFQEDAKSLSELEELDLRPRQSEAMARVLGHQVALPWSPDIQDFSLCRSQRGAWCPASKSARVRAGSRSPSQIKTMDVSCICPWQGQPSWQRH